MHLGKTGKTDKPTRSAFVAEQAREDLLNQNPNCRFEGFLSGRFALDDLGEEYKNALATIDGVKQTIRVKRTVMRGLEDRMKFFEQQVLRHMAQLANTVSKKNAA